MATTRASVLRVSSTSMAVLHCLPRRSVDRTTPSGRWRGRPPLALPEFPFADPAEPFGFRFGPDETHRVAMGDSGQRRFVGPPRQAGRLHAVGGQPDGGRGAEEERASLDGGFAPGLALRPRRSGPITPARCRPENCRSWSRGRRRNRRHCSVAAPSVGPAERRSAAWPSGVQRSRTHRRS
jgi:hypothetical protein